MFKHGSMRACEQTHTLSPPTKLRVFCLRALRPSVLTEAVKQEEIEGQGHVGPFSWRLRQEGVPLLQVLSHEALKILDQIVELDVCSGVDAGPDAVRVELAVLTQDSEVCFIGGATQEDRSGPQLPCLQAIVSKTPTWGCRHTSICALTLLLEGCRMIQSTIFSCMVLVLSWERFLQLLGR